MGSGGQVDPKETASRSLNLATAMNLGIITVDEVCLFIRQLACASGLPVLVDGDIGFGEALNIIHMVRTSRRRALVPFISRSRCKAGRARMHWTNDRNWPLPWQPPRLRVQRNCCRA